MYCPPLWWYVCTVRTSCCCCCCCCFSRWNRLNITVTRWKASGQIIISLSVDDNSNLSEVLQLQVTARSYVVCHRGSLSLVLWPILSSGVRIQVGLHQLILCFIISLSINWNRFWPLAVKIKWLEGGIKKLRLREEEGGRCECDGKRKEGDVSVTRRGRRETWVNQAVK